MTAGNEAPLSGTAAAGNSEPNVRPADSGRDVVLASGLSWARHIWWIATIAGVAGAGFVWVSTPHGREIDTAWELALKLVVFTCLCAAITFFPWAARGGHWLLYVPFVFFTGYVLPRISYFYYGDAERAQGDSFYTHLYLLLYPGIVLTVAAAYRLGGGSPGRCLKVMVTGVIIVFSGFLDLMWFAVNPVGLPDSIDAPHITLFTGGPISYGATIVFALAHLPVLVGINLLPLDRWIGRLLRAGEPAPPR